MEIGISIFGGIDFDTQAKLFKKYGVRKTFIMSETPDIDNVIKCFNENGVTLESLHAPFDRINDMWSEDKEKAGKMLDRLKNGVKLCSKHNIPVIVVHLSSGKPMPEITQTGVKRFEELFEYANEKGVKIALENQRFKENLSYFMDRYENVGFCWDTGHENCFTSGINFMELYGDRLCALHIHDNRCLADKDDHLLPFDANIDFDKVASFLAKSTYDKAIMLEVGKNAHVDGKMIYENMSDEEYVKRARMAAQKLCDMIESKKIR